MKSRDKYRTKALEGRERRARERREYLQELKLMSVGTKQVFIAPVSTKRTDPAFIGKSISESLLDAIKVELNEMNREINKHGEFHKERIGVIMRKIWRYEDMRLSAKRQLS